MNKCTKLKVGFSYIFSEWAYASTIKQEFIHLPLSILSISSNHRVRGGEQSLQGTGIYFENIVFYKCLTKQKVIHIFTLICTITHRPDFLLFFLPRCRVPHLLQQFSVISLAELPLVHKGKDSRQWRTYSPPLSSPSLSLLWSNERFSPLFKETEFPTKTAESEEKRWKDEKKRRTVGKQAW